MYLKHFGLQKDPFALTPSTDFYCHIAQYEQILKTILFSIHEREGFCLVVAEVGMGKTLLCRRLLNQLAQNNIALCYIYNPAVSSPSLAKQIATELGANLSDNADPYHAIHNRLLALSAEGKNIVLVVDEAQAAFDEGLEFIRLLTNLEAESRKLIQVVMFAQPEMLTRIQQHHFRQLAQRIVHLCQLRPFTESETNYFLQQRLLLSGRSMPLFSSRAQKLLWRYARGNPRVINIIAKRALLSAYSKDAMFIEHSDVKNASQEVFLARDAIKPNASTVRNQKYQLLKVGTVISVLILLISVIYWKFLL